MKSECRERCGHIRFFRDGQPEEYSVVLRPDGGLHSVHHDVAEAAAGASLSKEDALVKAQDFLAASQRHQSFAVDAR